MCGCVGVREAGAYVVPNFGYFVPSAKQSVMKTLTVRSHRWGQLYFKVT